MTTAVAPSDVPGPVGQPPPAGSRTGRVLGAVQVGYVYQAVVLVSGLWLAPFLIDRLGDHDYGLWLNGAQIVAWLYILDLGVIALLPRETAYAIGVASRDDAPSELPRLIGRTVMLLLWQAPFVAAIAAIVWLLLPNDYGALSGPLLLVFATFVAGFPLRVFQAVLQGLQDLVYVGVHTFIAWVIGFFLTVFLIDALGLYALAISFAAVQVWQYGAYAYRVWSRHRQVMPRRLSPIAWSEARTLLSSGTWVSVGQVAQVLLVGTDILIITNILGAEAVVPYTITAKLATALANQPPAIMQAALPGIAEIRGTADTERLQRAASALGQVLLILSTLVFCVVMGINDAFIAWWPGISERFYGGNLLTALILLAMVARHANFAVIYTLFSLGGERRISITTLADGLVTLIASVLFVREFGIIGAPMGSLVGVVMVSLPANLRGLALRAGVSVGQWLRPFIGLGWRFALLAVASAAVGALDIPPTIVWLALTGAAIALVVAGVMAPVAMRPPLGAYLLPRLPWRRSA